jgi:hypothetical protein
VLQVIEMLRRQRVRQGDLQLVLDCLIVQATAVTQLSPVGALAETARDMKSRALELRRIHTSVPKFVVEDLLEESIARLERAEQRRAAAAGPTRAV